MKRGNKVRYKKHLEFVVSETDKDNDTIIYTEEIWSYETLIGIVNYRDKLIQRTPAEQEFTPMNWKHLKWALGRAKNKTNQNSANSPWTIVG